MKNLTLPLGRDTFDRVPRADSLNLLRDTLHVLSHLGGSSSKEKLLNETEKIMKMPDRYFTDPSSFDDYLAVGKILSFLKIIGDSIIITEKGTSFVKTGELGNPELKQTEKKFLKSLLYYYVPFRRFIINGFRKDKKHLDHNQLALYNNCPTREELLKSYMAIKGHSTDREARTLLGWSQQVGVVEFDAYSHRYHLIEEKSYDVSTFLKDLTKVYIDTRDPKKKVALIPELRARFCCLNSVSTATFDSLLLELNFVMPSIVQLGKASSSREIVRRFGIHGKPFYYYYIKLIEELI